MPIIRKCTKSFIGSIFILAVFLAMLPSSFAEDYETPHEFKAGDVISADMMNEIFNYIRNSQKELTTSDLVGTWRCTAIVNPQRDSCTSEWQTHAEGFFYFLENATLTISDDGDGTFSFQTSAPTMFSCDHSAAQSGPILVSYGSMFINPTNTNPQQLKITQTSNTTILLENAWQSGFVNGLLAGAICHKQNLPPAIPTDLSATTSGFNVTLSWTDNSDDETGFKIMRKDSLTGGFNEIATTTLDTISYTDTVPSAGDYWYRAKATNDYGDSLGSNEILVTVTE